MDKFLLACTGVIINWIFHGADLHIGRMLEREEEYNKVFDNIRKEIMRLIKNKEGYVFVLCGDILNDNDNLNGLAVLLTKNIIQIITEFMDCIIIGGNHDLSDNNGNHDPLYSILKDLKTKYNVYYLREEGIYEYNNILFGHTKCEKKPKLCDCEIKTNKYKCALYHGTLKEASIYHKNDERFLSVNDFQNYDFVFLGDIHKRKFLTDTIAYSGSMIKQDIDEETRKGFILWDLKKKKGIFVDVYNEIAKIKFNLDENGDVYEKEELKIILSKKNKPKFLKVVCSGINKEHIDNFYKMFEKNGIKIIKNTEIITNEKFNTNIVVNGNNQDLRLLKSKNDVVKILMTKITENNNDIKQEDSQNIENILQDSLTDFNFEVNGETKNIKLLNLKFNNMNVFGENNNIDFTKFHEIVGFNANNSSGKSSFIDCIIQSIYGEPLRGHREDSINIYSQNYMSEIELLVNSVNYKIIQKVGFNGKDKSDTKIDILQIYENGKNISAKGVVETKKIIKKKLGTAEDFILSAIVTQKSMYKNKPFGFLEMSSEEKRRILCNVSKMDVFDYIYKEIMKGSNSEKKDLKKIEKEYNKYKMYGETINLIYERINKINNEIEYEIQNIKKENDNIQIKKKKNENELKKYENKLNIINNEIGKNEQEEMSECDDDEYKEITNENDKKMNENIKNIKNNNKIIDKNNNKIKSFGDNKKMILNFNKNKKIKIDKFKNKILVLKKKIKYCDGFENINIFDIKNEIIELEQLNKILGEEISQIQKDNKIYISIKDNINELENNKKEICVCNEKIKDLTKKENIIGKHEYDKKCKFCVKNNITIEKMYLEKLIVGYNDDINKLEKKNKEINKYISENVIDEDGEKYIENINMKKNMMNINDNKINETKAIIKKYQIYEQNIGINGEIKKLENEIMEIQNENNEDLEKKNKLMNENVQLKTETTDLMRENVGIEEENNEHKKKNDVFKNNKSVKKLKNDKNDIESDIERINFEEDALDSAYVENNNIIKQNIERIKIISEDKVNAKNIMDRSNDIERNVKYYNIILNVLGKNGLIDKIFNEMIIPKFEGIVNKLFVEFGFRKVKIEYARTGKDEENEGTIGIVIRDEYNINTEKDGGFQTFFNNLVYRLALIELSGNTTTNFMIIDEAFDAADKENKENVIKLMDYMKGYLDWLLIISHDDCIKGKINGYLNLKKIKDKQVQIEFIG